MAYQNSKNKSRAVTTAAKGDATGGVKDRADSGAGEEVRQNPIVDRARRNAGVWSAKNLGPSSVEPGTTDTRRSPTN